MSFHVQKWPDISNGWSDIPSKKEANKKGGEKARGGKIGRKERKKKGRKKERKGEVNKTKGKKGRRKGGKKTKNRKEKERNKSWDQVFKQKEVLCWDLTQCIGIYRHSSNFYYHWS